MKEKKKIKLLTSVSDFRIGGAQKVVADLLQHLDKDRFDIHLVTLFQSPEEKNFYDLLPEHIVVHKLTFSSFYDLKSWLSIYRLLKKIKPDIVWSHLFFSNTILRVLKPLFSYKVIIVEHNTYINKSLFQKLLDRLLSYLTFKIVAVSPGVATYTSRQERIPESKFIVIPNGINLDLFSPSNGSVASARKRALMNNPDCKLIVTVGQLVKQKNHELLVNAFSVVQKKIDCELIIIGDGALKPDLIAQIQTNDLEDKVHLLGVRKDVQNILAAADLFVLPSSFEGFALVGIEAMAIGVPVISTKVTGPDMYIKDGVNGFFCKGDVVKMADRIEQVLSLNNIEKDLIIDEARKTAAEYDIKKVAKEYETLFAV